MSETKPYKVTMNGTETTLMLDDDDAKAWGVAGQSAKDQPANLDDPDTVAAAEAAVAAAAADVAAKQQADQDAAAAKLTADLTEQAGVKADPVPAQDKQRRAPRSNKSNG